MTDRPAVTTCHIISWTTVKSVQKTHLFCSSLISTVLLPPSDRPHLRFKPCAWPLCMLSSFCVYVTHTHTRLAALCPGLPGWTATRKVKPIWILLKQEIVSCSGISWAICKSAPRSRQITMPALSFYRPDALPATQPTASKHWRQLSA